MIAGQNVAATPNVAMDYDAAGNRLWMTDGLGRVDYVHDQLSQLTSEKRSFSDSLPNAPLANNAYQLSYSYNRAGQLMSVTNPFGSQTSYARFNQSGEISGVSGSGAMSVPNYAGNLSYRAFRAAKQIGYGNGRQLSLSYDNRLRLTQWNIPGVMGWNYAYNYFNENNGRVTYAQNTNDSTLDRSYQYDHVGRLVSAHTGKEARAHIGIEAWNGMDGPYSQDRGYDQFGNATHRVGWGGYQGGGFDQSYSFTNNRLVQDPITGATIQYDAAGNLTNDGQQSFTYDATGQQATASFSGYALTQGYDGDGLRAKKNDNGAVTYYLRSSVLGSQVVTEVNSTGAWTRGYLYLGGQLCAIQQNNAVYWMSQDPVTKSQRVTDGSGNVVSTIDLDPWGGETWRSSNQTFQPHRYTSYERDNNGGDEAMMRRYHSYWNRFSQPDPYNGSYNPTDPQSFNRYAYTQNDPVNFIDPSGTDGEEFPIFYICIGGDCYFGFGLTVGPDSGDYGVSLGGDGGSEMGLLQHRPVGGNPVTTIPVTSPTPAQKQQDYENCIKNVSEHFTQEHRAIPNVFHNSLPSVKQTAGILFGTTVRTGVTGIAVGSITVSGAAPLVVSTAVSAYVVTWGFNVASNFVGNAVKRGNLLGEEFKLRMLCRGYLN